MTLESVVERLGIEKDEAFHDALADAIYTAKVCQFVDIAKGLADYPSEGGTAQKSCSARRTRRAAGLPYGRAMWTARPG